MLVFTPGNWNAPQRVTVTGVDDDLQDGRQTFEIAVSSVVMIVMVIVIVRDYHR